MLTLCIVGWLLAIFILLMQGSIYMLKYGEDKVVLLKTHQIRSLSGQMMNPGLVIHVMEVGKIGKVCIRDYKTGR